VVADLHEQMLSPQQWRSSKVSTTFVFLFVGVHKPTNLRCQTIWQDLHLTRLHDKALDQQAQTGENCEAVHIGGQRDERRLKICICRSYFNHIQKDHENRCVKDRIAHLKSLYKFHTY
jgi:hypothetical protein